MKKFKKILVFSLCVLLIGVIAFSGWQIYKGNLNYKSADDFYSDINNNYYPDKSYSSPNKSENTAVMSLIEKYPDTVGWLSLTDTTLDYPFVQAENNDKYLRADMNLNYLLAGTVFMDYRNRPDFSDFTTIIYGHNMHNDTMFGTLSRFKKDDFWNEHTEGFIYLPKQNYKLNLIAFLVVNEAEDSIYKFGYSNAEEKSLFLDFIKSNALKYREENISVDDRFVILSSCSSDYEGARMILVAKIADDNNQS